MSMPPPNLDKNAPKVSKFNDYDLPMFSFKKPEFIGDFTLTNFEKEDMDDIAAWAEDTCEGNWFADYAENHNEFIIKFQLEEDASMFKMAWG